MILVISKLHYWALFLTLFLVARIAFFGLFSEEVVILFVCYCLSLYWFVLPFLLKESMHIPMYGDELELGQDGIKRLIFFIIGIAWCVASLIV